MGCCKPHASPALASEVGCISCIFSLLAALQCTGAISGIWSNFVQIWFRQTNCACLPGPGDDWYIYILFKNQFIVHPIHTNISFNNNHNITTITIPHPYFTRATLHPFYIIPQYHINTICIFVTIYNTTESPFQKREFLHGPGRCTSRVLPSTSNGGKVLRVQ